MTTTYTISGLEAHNPEDLRVIEWDAGLENYVAARIDGEYCGITTVELVSNDLEHLTNFVDSGWANGDAESLAAIMDTVKTTE